MNKASLLRIFPILSDPSCTKQNTTRQSTHSNIDNTLLANTAALSTSVGNANNETNSNSKFKRTFGRSKGESPSISVEQNFHVSGMASFLEDYLLPNCKLAWKKWPVCCGSWKVHPFQCPVNYVLEYSSS